MQAGSHALPLSIVGGTSAGGLAAVHNCDMVGDYLHRATPSLKRYACVVDSGIFLDLPTHRSLIKNFPIMKREERHVMRFRPAPTNDEVRWVSVEPLPLLLSRTKMVSRTPDTIRYRQNSIPHAVSPPPPHPLPAVGNAPFPFPFPLGQRHRRKKGIPRGGQNSSTHLLLSRTELVCAYYHAHDNTSGGGGG